MNNTLLIPGLAALWHETTGHTDICIAILDGHVDLDHPCFNGSRLEQIKTIATENFTNDKPSQHGTHVASIIFGQHHTDVKGIAPGCRGLSIPIYPAVNDSKRVCSQLDLARAINQAIAQGAHIINISGGELSASGGADPILDKAIQQCVDSDILVVAAAGNDGCYCLHVPASISSVLAVGAMDGKGNPLSFSNWGDDYQKNGILALGKDILGAEENGSVVSSSGTSFAAPIVAGVAALLLSLQIKNGHEVSPHDIRKILLESADPCNQISGDCKPYLAGRLNIESAHSVLSNTPYIGISGQALTESISPFYPTSTGAEAGISRNILAPEFATHTALPLSHNSIIRSNKMNDISVPLKDTTGVNSYDVPAVEFSTPHPELNFIADANGIQPSAIEASDCGCNKTKTLPTTAYVLGQIGVDFGTEAKRDAFIQISGINIYDPAALLAYLKSDPASAANIIWTLSLDATVVYAIQPYGPFATNTYDRLKEFLEAQATQGVERVSIPGLISGSVRLINGQEVPVLYPDIRGMYSWSTQKLIDACVGKSPSDKNAALLHAEKIEGINNFLERIYYEVRNLGTSPQDRAMNYAASNAFQVSTVFETAIKTQMKLENISVERSPICRPGSDCWDVKLSFFNPAKRLEQARHVFRFTIDVSEVIPVTVGKVRNWDVY